MEQPVERGILWQALTNPYPNKPSTTNSYQSLYVEKSSSLGEIQNEPLKNEQREKYNVRRRIASLTQEQRERKSIAPRVISLTEEQSERRNARRRVIALNAEQIRKKRIRQKMAVITEKQRLYRNARRREYIRRKQMQNKLRLKQPKGSESNPEKSIEAKKVAEPFQINESIDNIDESSKCVTVSQNSEINVPLFLNNDVVKCENSVSNNTSEAPFQQESIDSFIESTKCEENLSTKTEYSCENPLQNCYEQNDWQNWVFNRLSEK